MIRSSNTPSGASVRSRSWTAVALTCVVAATLHAQEPEIITGHDRMVATLAEVAARTNAENPILGDSSARDLRGQLNALRPTAPLQRRMMIEFQLGERELRLGNLERGIELIMSARAMLERFHRERPISAATRAAAAYRNGVAHLRLGETQNCCLRHAAESCIMPIRAGGLHTVPDGSLKAIACFTDALRIAAPDSPLYDKTRWLLNIAYMTLDGYPQDVPTRYLIPPELFESQETIPRFANVAPDLGLHTFDLAGGVIIDDFDNDNDLDLMVSTWDPAEHVRFFVNNGDGTFSDRSVAAGLTGILGGFNLVQADYDNDGHLDLLVLRGAWLGDNGRIPNSLLHNNGDGTFTDVTFASGLGDVHYPAQNAGWADYDNDGDLDLYIGNESADARTGGPSAVDAPCQLFRNNGDGTFTDVAEAAGVDNRGVAKSVGWGDYDADGWPDLYVSNLAKTNRLYHNNQDGTFTDVADQLAVAGPTWSFSMWFWDFDNDGHLDLFVSSYDWSGGGLAAVVASVLEHPVTSEPACLYRADGNGGFKEVAREQGLTRLTLPMGANFGDLDNDGFLDFYLGTGYPDYEALIPNVMYRNQGGTGFSDVTWAGGFGHLQKGHGVVFADIDHDGDQDVFAQMGGFYPGDRFANVLFANPGFGNHWLTVKLVGVNSNRSAIGARIRVNVIEDGRERSIYRHVNSGGSFGANPLRQTLGLGLAARIKTLEILWPATGRRQLFDDVQMDQAIRIVEGEDRYTSLGLKSFPID